VARIAAVISYFFCYPLAQRFSGFFDDLGCFTSHRHNPDWDQETIRLRVTPVKNRCLKRSAQLNETETKQFRNSFETALKLFCFSFASMCGQFYSVGLRFISNVAVASFFGPPCEFRCSRRGGSGECIVVSSASRGKKISPVRQKHDLQNAQRDSGGCWTEALYAQSFPRKLLQITRRC